MIGLNYGDDTENRKEKMKGIACLKGLGTDWMQTEREWGAVLG